MEVLKIEVAFTLEQRGREGFSPWAGSQSEGTISIFSIQKWMIKGSEMEGKCWKSKKKKKAKLTERVDLGHGEVKNIFYNLVL